MGGLPRRPVWPGRCPHVQGSFVLADAAGAPPLTCVSAPAGGGACRGRPGKGSCSSLRSLAAVSRKSWVAVSSHMRVSSRCPVSTLDTKEDEMQAISASAIWVMPCRSRAVRSRTPASSRAGPRCLVTGRSPSETRQSGPARRRSNPTDRRLIRPARDPARPPTRDRVPLARES